MPPVLSIVAIVRRRQSLLQRRQQFGGDGSNLPDFAEVAFVLVADRLLPEPLVLFRDSVAHDTRSFQACPGRRPNDRSATHQYDEFPPPNGVAGKPRTVPDQIKE
jgi:hypothetical protein